MYILILSASGPGTVMMIMNLFDIEGGKALRRLLVVHFCLYFVACSSTHSLRGSEPVHISVSGVGSSALTDEQTDGVNTNSARINEPFIPSWNKISEKWLAEAGTRFDKKIIGSSLSRRADEQQHILWQWEKHLVTAYMACRLLRSHLVETYSDKYISEDIDRILENVLQRNGILNRATSSAPESVRNATILIATGEIQYQSLELVTAWLIMVQQDVGISSEVTRTIVSRLAETSAQSRGKLSAARDTVYRSPMTHDAKALKLAEINQVNDKLKRIERYATLLTADDTCAVAYASQALLSRLAVAFFAVFPDKCKSNGAEIEEGRDAASCTVSRGGAFTVDVKALNLKNNPFSVQRLQRWGGNIVVHGNGTVYVVDVDREELISLQIEGCDVPLTVAEDGGSQYVLCRQTNELIILSKTATEKNWMSHSVGEAEKSPHNWLHCSKTKMTVVTGNAMFRSTDGGAPRRWEKISVSDQLNPPTDAPSDALLLDNEVWLGYDRGEWGGTLHKYMWANNSAVSSESGSDSIEDKLFLGVWNIVRLKSDDNSNVWALSQLEHMSLKRMALFKFGSSSIDALVNQWRVLNRQDNLPMYAYPHPRHCIPSEGVVTAFDVMAEDVYLFAGDVGVMKIHDNALSVIIDAEFSVLPSIESVMKKDEPNEIDYFVSTAFDEANDMLVLKNESILLATPRLGVLYFSRQSGKYKTRQLLAKHPF